MKEENSKLTVSILKLSKVKGSIRIYKIQLRKPYTCEKMLILYTCDNLDNRPPSHPPIPRKLSCRYGHKSGKRPV